VLYASKCAGSRTEVGWRDREREVHVSGDHSFIHMLIYIAVTDVTAKPPE